MSELELTNMTGVGDSLAEKLQDYGVSDVEQLARQDAHLLTNIKGVRIKRAENLINNAKDHLDDVWENRQWDGTREVWYDAGPDMYECVCGYRIGNVNAFKAHQQNCYVYNNTTEVTCEDCGWTYMNLPDDDDPVEEGDYCRECGHQLGESLNVEEDVEESKQEE